MLSPMVDSVAELDYVVGMTNTTPIVITDGGRRAAGFTGSTGDCVTRALAVATEVPYIDCYNLVASINHHHGRPRSARNGAYTPRSGRGGYMEVLDDLFRWEPLMGIGTGTRVHLRQDELPPGIVIARVSGHLCTAMDGVVHDSHDPTRGGTRAVYGVWHVEAPVPGPEMADYWSARIEEWQQELDSRPRKKVKK